MSIDYIKITKYPEEEIFFFEFETTEECEEFFEFLKYIKETLQ